MLCDLCGIETTCIYVTSKYGSICGECYRKMRNGNKGKLKQYEKRIALWKKYGLKIEE